jgi:putative radical SAM enzyme (TIGR03279 family)
LNYGIIATVYPDSLAEELGLLPQDKILTVNGQNLQDIIDLSFAFAEEEIEMLVEHPNGEQEIFEFDKEYDEELGVEFASAVFDGIKRCHNKCHFCFVDQLPPKMRPSLYVKDDDYRMSFLYGNFVTMTNMTEEDFCRIERLHMTPLFISVHTTNGALRAQLMHNKSAADIMEKLARLKQANVEIHTQIVLCPNINDGKELEKTLDDLLSLRPMVLSVAIVPVGLTKYREKCYPLEMFSKEQAKAVIALVSEYQKKSREKYGDTFIYLGDEFYFMADMEMPKTDLYDGFPQLDNGIGLTRNFIDEWDSVPDETVHNDRPLNLAVVCGKSAAAVIERLTMPLNGDNLKIKIISPNNEQFGENITVTGLLTGQDIFNAVQKAGEFDGIIIPSSALRADEDIFLDDMTLEELQSKLKTSIKAVCRGDELKKSLISWQDAFYEPHISMQYAWQSNAAYSKNK